MSADSANTDTSDSSHNAADASCSCRFCGLPATPVGQSSLAYCCYGCRFAHSIVKEQGEPGAIRWTVVRLGLSIFFTMNLMAFTMVVWSLDVYEVEPDPLQQTLFSLFRWLSLLLAIPVLVMLGLPLISNALHKLRNHTYSTDLLVCLAVAAAFLTSVLNVIRESGHTYFEVGAAVLVMITLGRWIEAVGKQKATEALDRLAGLLPASADRIHSEHFSEPGVSATTTVPTSSLRSGDLLRIRAGARFPVDACIYSGQTSVDEQVFTGESLPVNKKEGDPVLAGTVNLDGDLVVRATSEFRKGSFGRLLETLRLARESRGYYQTLADRVVTGFLPLVTVVAFLTFAWHLRNDVNIAIQSALSVLLIACPCAMGLATPLAIWTSLSTAIRHQVLFRSGEALEQLADARFVCLDKTGTLTTGTPRVFQMAVLGQENPDLMMQLANRLADSSTHPFSQAIVNYCNATESSDAQLLPVGSPALDSCRTVSGGGVEATTTGDQVLRLGSVEFACCRLHSSQLAPGETVPELCVACQATVPLDHRIQLDRLRMAADHSAASIVLLSVDRQPALGFLISETIRPKAAEALHQLVKDVDSLHVLSGDRVARGRFLKEQLGIRELSVHCGLLPEQKVSHVSALSQQSGTTVMVGDGINDAPALAASDIGIAMGCGADVARDSAQVCLLSDDLMRISWAIRLARRTTTVVRQNLFWAFGYNAVGVAIAATGFLNPAIAAGLMIASSLLVISNSLRLLNAETINADVADNTRPPTTESSAALALSPTSTSELDNNAAPVTESNGRLMAAEATS